MAQKTSRRTIARIIAARLADEPAKSAVIMKGLAAYLVEHKMTDQADVLINDIADELYALTGRLTVEVASAHALSDAGRAELISYFKNQTQASNVFLHETVDESLIGGLVAKTPAAELDVSVRGTLRQLTAIA